MAKAENSAGVPDKPTIKIQLDMAWRSDMDGAEVVGGRRQSHKEESVQTADLLEKKVLAEANQGAVDDLAKQTKAMKDMTIAAIGQATGPTSSAQGPSPAAGSPRPSQRPRRRSRTSSSSSSA